MYTSNSNEAQRSHSPTKLPNDMDIKRKNTVTEDTHANLVSPQQPTTTECKKSSRTNQKICPSQTSFDHTTNAALEPTSATQQLLSQSSCVDFDYGILNSTQDTLLPGYTSTHASANPSYNDTATSSIIIEGIDLLDKAHDESPWLSTRKGTFPDTGKAKKFHAKKGKQAAKRSARAKKNRPVQIGMTVSGKFGELPPKSVNGSVKRRTRKKKIAKVIGSKGKGLFEIRYLDGSIDIKKATQLTVEADMTFDDIFQQHTKSQSYLPFEVDKDTNGNVRVEKPTQCEIGNDVEGTTAAPNDSTVPDYSNAPNVEEYMLNDDDSHNSMPDLIRRDPGYESDDDDVSDDDSTVPNPACEEFLPSFDEEYLNEADIFDLNKKRDHAKKMSDAKEMVRQLNGTKYVIDGHTKKQEKITWEVVDSHTPPNGPPMGRPMYSLGIRNKTTLSSINRSSIPLADMFLFLSFKDGMWWVKLGKMNSKIVACNKANEFDDNYRKVTLFTAYEFIACYAMFIGSSAYNEYGASLWAKDDSDIDPNWKSIYGGPDFGSYGITLHRFKQWKQYVPRMWECEFLQRKEDPWWRFAGAIDEFNEIRNEDILTSTERVLDESMSAFRPRTTKLGNLPNISYILRKPEPLGTELKSSVCTKLKIMTYLEIQRGKQGMTSMMYNKQMGATAGCAMRIAEGVCQTHIDGKQECILGDSWFGSVRAICNIKLKQKKEGVFQIKTNSRGFPKKQIHSVLKDAPGGTYIILKGTDPDTGVKLVATGYKYNRKTVLCFVSTEAAGSLELGEPYEMRFPDRYGNVVVRDVPRPDMISKFFSKSNVVDVHNQVRQYGLRLEKKWVTCNPYFRLHTTLTGINVVDTLRLSQHHGILNKERQKNLLHCNNESLFCRFDNGFIEESNAVTIKQFAGILARQLFAYAKAQRRKVSVSNPNINISYHDNDSMSSDESLKKEGQEKYKNELYGTTMIEVLDVVYDVNGKKHHAVKNEFREQYNGKNFTSSRVCQNVLCNHKSRVKCLECSKSFCFPIRQTSTVSKTNNCFVRHVQNVTKQYGTCKHGYIDLSGRKNP